MVSPGTNEDRSFGEVKPSSSILFIVSDETEVTPKTASDRFTEDVTTEPEIVSLVSGKAGGMMATSNDVSKTASIS